MKLAKKTDDKIEEQKKSVPATPTVERLLKRWHDAVVVFKVAEVNKKTSADAVAAAIVESGGEVIISKRFGGIPLRYTESKSFDAEGMLAEIHVNAIALFKEMGLSEAAALEKLTKLGLQDVRAMSELIAKHTKTTKSKPFVKSPDGWTKEAA